MREHPAFPLSHLAVVRGPALCATWSFAPLALKAGSEVFKSGGGVLDAVEKAVNAVELDTAQQYYVGYGGMPNADGVMELDAAFMDGRKCRYGAVMALQGVRTPISVARCAGSLPTLSTNCISRLPFVCVGSLPPLH